MTMNQLMEVRSEAIKDYIISKTQVNGMLDKTMWKRHRAGLFDKEMFYIGLKAMYLACTDEDQDIKNQLMAEILGSNASE